ncbi:MAG TPA: tRNA (adenosine(37)-N6)-threonylcarbamoyltransferase complex transferase subunit TsaD, partial [Pseudomonas sp.]|nr:tRNA (adenosine(37)-N6)-threonylcarbamoyltransferase complex transferase subunit TsaD [Pseudomonas sp.]
MLPAPMPECKAPDRKALVGQTARRLICTASFAFRKVEPMLVLGLETSCDETGVAL